MNTNHNHDASIDKTIAALKSAALPEGMEARILQRLQQPAQVAHFRWRDLLTGSALAAAWWRGAFSGAAAAMFLVGALLLTQHSLRAKRPAVSQVAVTHNLAPTALPVAASAGCPAPAQVHHASGRPAPELTTHRHVSHPWIESSASFAPSHPAPVMPLTAQERALVRLVQTVNPKQLASFSLDAQEKAVTQETDDFNKFFAPPPAPPQPADSESPTNTQENRTAPQQGEQI